MLLQNLKLDFGPYKFFGKYVYFSPYGHFSFLCMNGDYGMVKAVQTTKPRRLGKKLPLQLPYVSQINTNSSKSL